MGTITDTDNGSQARIEQNYHLFDGIPKYELIGYAAYYSSQAGIYGFHKTIEESYYSVGSMYGYHLISGDKLIDYYDTGMSIAESRGALVYTHIAAEKWILAANRGSMQN